jgi:hypothetical protein
VAGLAVFVLLWPAMWVEPVWTAWRVLRAMVGYAGAGHEAQLFFNGAVVSGDPGAHFYPLAYLWRVTPPVLVGSGLLALAWLRRRTVVSQPFWRPLGALALFALLFALFMTLGAKKFDRYLLPVFPPLALMAGAGWLAVGRWLGEQRPALGRLVAPGIAAVVAVSQAACAAASYPYYLSYYNPVLGGAPAAAEVMTIGWGEGLDQVAEYLEGQGPGEAPPVTIGVWTGTFSYLYGGEIWHSSFAAEPYSAEAWRQSEYLVVYVNQWQRQRLPAGLMEHMARMTPVFTARIDGLDYAYVYDIRRAEPPEYMLAGGEE